MDMCSILIKKRRAGGLWTTSQGSRECCQVVLRELELRLHEEKLPDLPACFWTALYQENLLLERGIQRDNG